MRALFRYLLALAALLAIWQIGSLALGEFLLPRPLDVLAYFGEALTTGAFWQHAGASAWRVLSAMSLAWLVAFPLGLILGHVRSVDNTLSPMVFLTYPLPKIVLLPLFLTLFGLGDLPRVLLIALTRSSSSRGPARRGSTKNISTPSAPSAGRRCRCCGMCSSPPPCPTP